jgi:carbonic anhydrase/acetyltransferase-like protein (isoleucine patch superfamily)
VDVSAQVIGDVELGDHSSVWMNAVLRGDVHSIRIGPYTNIQDNSVVHVMRAQYPTILADHVTVGHSVTLHGCRIGSFCLIGMGAILLNGVHVGTGSIVGAGAVVREGMQIPPNSLVLGVPGRVTRETTADERERIKFTVDAYLSLQEEHRAGKHLTLSS